MEGLREWAEEKMKMTEERTEGKIELYSTLMESFEKKFGIKYNDKGYAEHVAQMCDLSLRRIKSYTKNFYNKIDKRIENCENLKTAKEKEIKNPWLVDALDNYKKITGQPYLYKHQISGFNSTYEKWEENSKQIVETTSKLSFERGDKNFYMYLAKILAEKKLTKSIRDDVYTYFDIDSLKEDRDTVWWNVVRHISIESPEPFSFGNSKPNLDYNLDEKTVTFSFLDEKIPVYFESERIFKELSVKCSNRDCNNCNYTDKEWKCSLCGTLNNKRKHHGLLNNVHFKLTNGGHDVFPERKNQTIAVMLFIRNGNWYVKFSVTFKRNRQKFVDKSKPDLRILALDLGQRKPGYYTIMERCDKDKEWFYKNGNCCLKIVKHGKLDDLLETYSGKKIDILSDHNVTKKVQGKPEKSTTKFMEDMGNFVENKLKDSVKFLKEMREGNCNFSDDDLIHKCDTILGRNKDNTITIRGQGGLSFSRLDRMDNVIRAISSYVDYRIDNGQAVSNKVNEYLVRLRQKVQNCKTERMRRTVSALLKVLRGNAVDVIVCEKLDVKPSKKSSKKMNRRTRDWRAIRVLKQIREQCKFYQIEMREVDPKYTSLEDYSDTDATGAPKLKCRYNRLNRGDSCYIYYERYIENKKKKNDSKRHEATYQAWLDFFEKADISPEDLLKGWKPKSNVEPYVNDEYVYVPAIGGEYYLHKKLGWIDSDENASINIGLRELGKIIK